MASSNACKLLCLVLLFALVAQGYGHECEVKDIPLKQSKTGKLVKGKPEWEVKLTNPCTCTVLNIRLSCPGFKSVTPVDVVSKTGDECLLNEVLGGHGDWVFNYVWDKSFDLKITDISIACS